MGAAPLYVCSQDTLQVPRHGAHCAPSGEGSYRLHYCDWGRADNTRVAVCVHGYGRTARDFDDLARDLSTHFRVICPDLAGRGDRDWLGTAAKHDFAQLLTDLDGLLSGLGIEEVDWIGTSLGGILGMHMAVQPGVSIRHLVMKNVGECMPIESSPHSGRALSAPLAGVHSVDLWKRVMCPTVLLRGDAPAVSSGEVDAIRRFLMAEARVTRRESYACAPA